MHSQLSDGRAVVIQPSFSPDAFVEDIHKYIYLAYDLINPI